MYRFLATPRWLVAHLVVVAIVAVFISLGSWQLRRLDERRAANAQLELRLANPEMPLPDLVDGIGGPSDGEALAYRRVIASGIYDTSHEVLARSRVYEGQNGFHVLTPLVTGDGRAVMVNRGWVPLQWDQPPVDGALPPDGEVVLAGVIRASESRSGLGPSDPAEGPLERMYWIDITRLQAQVPYTLYPVYVQLLEQQPPQSGPLPVPAPLPELDEGPHLSYAIQWFSFTVIALVGYGALIRTSARRGESRRASPVDSVGGDNP